MRSERRDKALCFIVALDLVITTSAALLVTAWTVFALLPFFFFSPPLSRPHFCIARFLRRFTQSCREDSERLVHARIAFRFSFVNNLFAVSGQA